MTRPQSNDVRRSGTNPALEPEAAAATRGTHGRSDDGHGAVPEDNRPGHHPDVEQDRPDPDAFLARARTVAQRTGTDDTHAAGGTDGEHAEDPATAMWAADPEAAAASPVLVARSAADGVRRVTAGVVRAAASALRHLSDVIEPG